MEGIESLHYPPKAIAAWFVNAIDREAGDLITHLKLQKLLYYAQAWSLVLNQKALFEEDFEAWTHGPVLPSIYEKYKSKGHSPLDISEEDSDLSEETLALLQEVMRVYGEKSARHLEKLTHQEKPWLAARGSLPLEARCTNKISKESMLAFYSEMLVGNEE